VKPSGAPATILVAEDESLLRLTIVSALRDDGWTVWETSSGEEAIARLQSAADIDIVFTDIQLAGELSGWDIAEQFRALRADGKVIYASGNARNRSRQVADSLFFDKPYLFTEVVAACARCRE